MKRFALHLAMSAVVMMALSACQQETIKGSGGKSLTMQVSRSVSIRRGMSRTLEVDVSREDTRKPVTVSLGQLPSGVSARQSSRTIETDSVAFILTADDDADLVRNHAMTVTVDGPDGMSGTEHVQITVTD